MELAEHGDITALRMYNQPACFINRPDLIRDLLVTNNAKFHKGLALQRAKKVLGEGLLTSEDETHLKQRRMIQPAFHRKRIEEYCKAMSFYADKISNEWKDGETLEMDSEMMRLTLAIVGKTLFNSDVLDDASDVGEALNALMEMFNYLLIPFSSLLQKLPFGPGKKMNESISRLDSVMYKIIDERRTSGTDEGDLLSMLLLAQDEDDGGFMDDKQVRDEALTLFIAGHETTANALVFTWYLLSQHEDVRAELSAELESVLGGRVPEMSDVADLKFTEAAIAESMRLYPPAWAVGRLAIADHQFDDYVVPKGTLILTSPYAIHHDKRYWDAAEEFRPQRWFDKSIREAGQEFIYYPFSRGVRSCIGESFAWSELILVVATIAQKWRFELDPNQKIGLNPVMTLRPKYGMKMKAKRIHE